MYRERSLLITLNLSKKDKLASYGRDLAAAPTTQADVAAVTQQSSISSVSVRPANVVRVQTLVRRTALTMIDILFRASARKIQGSWSFIVPARIRRRHTRTIWTSHEVVHEVDLLRAIDWLFNSLLQLDIILSRMNVDCYVRHGVRAVRHGVLADRVVDIPYGISREPTVRAPFDCSSSPVLCFGFLRPDEDVEHQTLAMDEPRWGDPVPKLAVSGLVRPRRGMFRLFEHRDHWRLAHLRSLTGPPIRLAVYLGDEALDAHLLDKQIVLFCKIERYEDR